MRTRDLTPDALAAALTERTGRPHTAADLPPDTTACAFDADTLDAVSAILAVPLPALLHPSVPESTSGVNTPPSGTLYA
ncbi:hypothetical protein GCM10022254_34780 [Actinomadura meridiana]|uniref:Uncharacterized protein n=1 Tax=Actinomadura meridiana TaxID=559626 RepID=A0ABP8C3L9_9ACTN